MKFCLPTVCLATIFFANIICPGTTDAQEFTRSTIPLKSGGSMTSIESQGQRVAYLNRQAPERTADARDAFNGGSRNWNFDKNSNANPSSDRHETGFAQSTNANAGSFYRRAQNGAASADTYPYPTLSRGANARVGTGFNAQLAAAANRVDNSRADFRFDRSGFGERPSGALGDTQTAAASNRIAQLPKPPTQLPASQLPDPAAALPGAVPAFGGAANFNLGPNYVNPAANFANGYQGYQPQPQAANSVPALNIQMPQTAGRNNNPNCYCVPQNNACCAQQPPAGFLAQPQPGFGGYAGYQFQPNLGTPQLNRTNAPFSSLLAGSGRSAYTPLIQFRNMPPGTYLGQGVIGQPTAYVDGQPIRNLIRYVSP